MLVRPLFLFILPAHVMADAVFGIETKSLNVDATMSQKGSNPKYLKIGSFALQIVSLQISL